MNRVLERHKMFEVTHKEHIPSNLDLMQDLEFQETNVNFQL